MRREDHSPGIGSLLVPRAPEQALLEEVGPRERLREAPRGPLRVSPRDLALLVASNLVWGASYVVARSVLDTTPPLVLAFARSLVAALALPLLLGLLRGRREEIPRRLSRADVRELAAMGLIGLGVSRVLYYEGLARSTAQDAALIINLEAVFTAVGAAWLLGQHLRSVQWLGVLAACAGGVLLVLPSGAGGQAAARSLGNALMVGAAAAEAAGTLLGARAMRRLSGLQVTAYGTYWGTLFLLAPAWWQWRAAGGDLSWLTPGNVLGLLYLSLAATVLAYTLWYHALARVPAGSAATFLYLQPLVGVLLAAVLLHSWPTALALVGGGLVLLGVYLSSRPAAR